MSLKHSPGIKGATTGSVHYGLDKLPGTYSPVQFTVPPAGSPINFLGVSWTWSDAEGCYVREFAGADGRLKQEFLEFSAENEPMRWHAFIGGAHYRGTWWPM